MYMASPHEFESVVSRVVAYQTTPEQRDTIPIWRIRLHACADGPLPDEQFHDELGRGIKAGEIEEVEPGVYRTADH